MTGSKQQAWPAVFRFPGAAEAGGLTGAKYYWNLQREYGIIFLIDW